MQHEDEQTYDNMPFNEVEKIYTGKLKCYKIKPFYTSIPASRLYGTDDNKSLLRKRKPFENFYCLYLDKAQRISNSYKSPGVIRGFSIDRMILQVPANKHD